jgi:hypothetical protein
MSYEFTIDDATGILIAKHQGSLTVQEAMASCREGIPLLNERGI